MADTRQIRDKLSGYLRGLPPGTQQMLLRTLEGMDKAAIDKHTQLILDVVREIAREHIDVRRHSDPDRLGQLRALFWEPFGPFIIDEPVAVRQPARVLASSVEGIWNFLNRDVASDLFAPWIEGSWPKLFLPAADLRREAIKLRDAAFEALADAVRQMEAAPKGQLRLNGILGSERARLELGDIFHIHARRADFSQIQKELPALAVIGEASETSAMNVVHRALMRHPADAAHIAALLLSRSSSPVTLARIAAALGGGDSAGDIRKSAVAPFIDLYFCEIERAVLRFEEARARYDGGPDMDRELGHFHEAVRGIAIAIDFDGDRDWRKRLGDLRRRMSDLVQPEIDAIVPLIRRALRTDGAAHGDRASDGHDAVRAMTVLNQARRCRDSLAINELIARVAQSAEQAIEVLGNRCIDEIRKSSGLAQAEAIAAADIMLKLAEIAFGPEYASVMRKARDRAVGRPGTLAAVG